MNRSDRFPPIGENSSSKEGLSTKRGVGSRGEEFERLPRLPANIVGHGKSIGRENSKVVGTSESHAGELPEDWTQMRVNPPQHDDAHMTKMEWENQIAKHILSLFATTHAVQNIQEGTALLDFVDVDKSAVKSPDGKGGVADDVNLLHTRPTHPPPKFENSDDKNQNIKKKKKAKRQKKTKKGESNEADQEGVHLSNQSRSRHIPEGVTESQFDIAERVIMRVHAEAERAEKAKGGPKACEKDKHRITNTIKLKDGREIVVRGAPRCFPIWFVSTGDVYADWTALPGGAKLQAHLNVLYEQQKYHDYLGTVETIIVEKWRKIKFGEEDFTLGSFGNSAHVSAIHSGTNTGINTARSRKGSTGHNSRHESRRNSHSGETSHLTGSMSFHRPGSPSSSFSPEDSQFGAGIIWEDAGEEGLIPKKLQRQESSAGENRSPTQQHAGISTSNKRRSGKATGTGDKEPISRNNSGIYTNSNISGGDDREGTLSGLGQNSQHEIGISEQLPASALAALWRQLVLAGIAMGILYLEKKQPDQAMLLFKRAEEWAANDDIVTSRTLRRELKAHVRDAISYYFFKRKKSIAALGYAEQAMELYEESDNIDGIAMCLLHVAAVYSQIGDFKEAHKNLFQFLAMVESGRLAQVDATPKQLCLVAIGYHNLAVVQLKLAVPDLACKNSQNARKIARLCLSYSNRWIDIFQYTHEIALSDLKYELSSKQAGELSPAQLALVIELSEALFDPYSDVNQDQTIT